MATIYGPKNTTTQADGVKSITEVKMYAFKRVIDGEERTGLAMVFGKLKDGGAGVFVLAEGQSFNDQVKIASDSLRDAIRQKHAESGDGDPGEMPQGLTEFDPNEG